jgi:hypothetical protein
VHFTADTGLREGRIMTTLIIFLFVLMIIKRPKDIKSCIEFFIGSMTGWVVLLLIYGG